ncbi:MAG: polysaccharide pyruvyl transferase family protein [Candidatus Moraniibacteriota bacterium]
MNKKYNILLFGHGSYLNKGCEAIVTNTSKTIKEFNRSNKLTVATFDIENDKKYYNDIIDKYVIHEWAHKFDREKIALCDEKKVDIEEMAHKDVVKEIERNDLFISVGGDNYCYNVSNWLYFIDKKIKEKNKKLILWGASVNAEAIDEKFIKDIREFDIVLVRESLTYGLLSKFIDEKKIILGPDIAFSLEIQKINLPEKFNSKEGIVGLNISPMILNYQSDKTDIIASVKKLIDYILSNHKYKIALIPHVYIEDGNDLDTLEKIKEMYSNDERVFVLKERIYNCNELKYIISKCRFLIAARTHASIAGYSTYVPTLVLGYSIKSKGIAKDIFGNYEDYVLPIEEMSEKKLIEKFKCLVENEEKIKNVLEKKMPIFEKESDKLFEVTLEKLEKLDSENVTKKEGCSGCGACANSCPQKAIEMKEDNEGFLFPNINKQKCIECNICRNICPNNKNYAYEYDNLLAYACKNISKNERLKSSSGGVFSLLARNILKQGGCVFGATYFDYEVKHIKIDNEKDLSKLRGSKYVQSIIGDCYNKVKQELESEKKVLFSGTPCQIEGLRAFLGKDYSNLYCVSVVCHGVPSKKVFLKNIKELEKQQNDILIEINFRNKEKGWKNYQVEYIFKNKSVKKKIWEDSFMIGFLKNYYLRQSCYDCEYRLSKKSTADIILGDFWGIDIEDKNFDDDRGVSAVIVNSEKGLEIFEKIRDGIIFKTVKVEQIYKYNTCLKDSVVLNKERFEFFGLLEKNKFDLVTGYLSNKKDEKLYKNIQGKIEIVHISHKKQIIMRTTSLLNLIFLIKNFTNRYLKIGYYKILKIYNKLKNNS